MNLENYSLPPDRITARPGIIQERYIELPHNLESIRCLGGTAILSQYQEDKASMSFLAYQKINWPYSSYSDSVAPTAIVVNGGPSTPATAHNSQIFGGPWKVDHGLRGYLGENARLVFNPDALVNHCNVCSLDLVGTGKKSELITRNGKWHLGTEMDSKTVVAFIEFGLNEGIIHLNSPLILVGSSYGAFRMTGAALELARRGINVAGLVIMSGFYDYWLKQYNQDIDPMPFVTSLPAIAAVNNYHRRLTPGYYEAKTRILPEAQLFDDKWKFTMADDFAQGEYKEALEADRLTGRQFDNILRKLVGFTGLDPEVIESKNLRINPFDYTEEIFVGKKVISCLDGRLIFDRTDDVKLDPMLDDWEQKYIDALINNPDKSGWPETFAEGYRGIVDLDNGNWEYSGIMEDKTVHKAMCELIDLNPDIKILDFNGYYDLNCPAPRSRMFWREMQALNGDITVSQKTPVTLFDKHEFSQYVKVYTNILPMGHQLNSDLVARHNVGEALRSFSNFVVRCAGKSN